MKKRHTREEERLHRAAVLLRFVVLIWIAFILAILLAPECFAAETAVAAAEIDPTTRRFAMIGAIAVGYYGTMLVLKLDEPRRKRGYRR